MNLILGPEGFLSLKKRTLFVSLTTGHSLCLWLMGDERADRKLRESEQMFKCKILFYFANSIAFCIAIASAVNELEQDDNLNLAAIFI